MDGLSHNSISSILDSIDSIVYVADLQTYKILFANRYARNMLGYITGETCWKKVWNNASGPCDPCSNMDACNSSLAPDRSDRQTVMNTTNGRWYEIIGRHIHWSDGQIVRLDIASDITERKWVQEMNRRSFIDWENTFDTMDDLITIQDRNFNIIRANRAAETIFGLPLKEIVRSKCYSLFHGRSAPPRDCPTCQCLESRHTCTFEYYEPHINRHLEAKVVPRLNASNHIVGLVHIVKDITKRKKTENELDEHRERLSCLVDKKTAGLNSAIELLNNEILHRKQVEENLRSAEHKYRLLQVVSECNNALLHIEEEKELLEEICRIIVDSGGYRLAWVGYVESDEDKKVQTAAFAGNNSEYVKTFTENGAWPDTENSPLWIAIKSGKSSRALNLINHPGPELWRMEAAKKGFCSILSIPMFAEQQILGILNIYSSESEAFNDEEINPLEKMTDNLSYRIRAIRSYVDRESARAESLRSSHMASLGELAAGVAHEINNPINGVINYAQMLVNDSSRENRDLLIAKRIIKESERIAGIVRNLLSFAHDRDEGKVPTNIREIVSCAISLTETQLRKDGITLYIDILPLSPTIHAQPRHLEQVFINIISNARYALNQKYPGIDERKTLQISVKTATVRNRHFLLISFYDRGTGIPASNMNKILNPFFTTKASNIGSGLGLSISHGIISDHGGKISVDSIEGEYTKVTIELPVSVKVKNEGSKEPDLLQEEYRTKYVCSKRSLS